jgi:hypothetical protein
MKLGAWVRRAIGIGYGCNTMRMPWMASSIFGNEYRGLNVDKNKAKIVGKYPYKLKCVKCAKILAYLPKYVAGPALCPKCVNKK